MRENPRSPSAFTKSAAASVAVMAAALLTACSTPPPPPPAPAPPPPPPAVAPVAPAPAPAPAPVAPARVAPLPPGAVLSNATSPTEYRKDGARHIYSKNAQRIFKGKMPPLLQGVGVLQLDIDQRGEVVSLNWMRPPSHSGAKAEIERTARAAAPYPVPHRLGRVTYTDIWLWHESGQFQLDTLTEGQRDR